MNIIRDFISLFTNIGLVDTNLDLKENLYEANVSYNFERYSNPDYNAFFKTSTLISEILGDYSFEFEFKVIDEEQQDFNLESELFNTISNNTNYDEKLNNIYQEILSKNFEKIEDTEFIRLEITIKKPMEFQRVNRVFFFDSFVESLNKLSLHQIIVDIASKSSIKPSEDILFLIEENIHPFNSENIHFVHNNDDIQSRSYDDCDYNNLILNHRLNCHFINSNFNLTPQAFKLIHRSHNMLINSLFDKLLMVTSIIYIANYSELIYNGNLNIRINGYKLINNEVSFKEIEPVSAFFEIFNWIYADKNISDKLELSRNIISLDYKECLNDISDKTLASIKSNYTIYLKENVEQYIELKNQITNNILDLSIKSRDIIDNFSSNFRNAFLANLSFIFSILILNLIGGDSKIDNIFNKDLSILYLIIIAMSILYMILSIITTNSDLNHYDSTFYNLKGLYSGLLSKEDLGNTFDNSILRSDKRYIKDRIILYSIFWFFILLTSLVGLYYLSNWFEVKVNNNLHPYIQIFKYIN